MTEQTNKNAYEAMKAFRKIAGDDLEFYAVAIEYGPDIEKVYKETVDAGNEQLAQEIKSFLDDLKANISNYSIIKEDTP